MVINHRLFLLSFLILLIVFASSYQISGSKIAFESVEKTQQNSNGISGKITIIVFNLEAYYTSDQVTNIKNFVKDVLVSTYPSCSFNVTVLNDSTTFVSAFSKIISLNNPDYVVIMGGVNDQQAGSSNDNTSYSVLLQSWTKSLNYTNIKQIGLIDFMESNSRFGVSNYISSDSNPLNKSITFANVNLKQAGFMAGVKASLLTETDKIGLILDHSLQINFYHRLESSQSQTGENLNSFNRADFVDGFIAGVKYSAEYLLSGKNIQIKTMSYDFVNVDLTGEEVMTNNVKSLSDFGADTIFNMESGLDGTFLQESSSLSIKTGILGDNNTSATFSMVENNSLILANMLNSWNSTITSYEMTYDLSNASILSLYPIIDSQLSNIQTLLLNGTINLNNSIPIEGVPGFEFVATFIPIILVIFWKKIKNYKFNKKD